MDWKLLTYWLQLPSIIILVGFMVFLWTGSFKSHAYNTDSINYTHVGKLQLEEEDYTLTNLKVAKTAEYQSFRINLPLVKGDDYWGKYENALAATKEFEDKVDVLYPGDKMALVADGIITSSYVYGYQTSELGYGSGSCWFVTALGGLMDQANKHWKDNYGYELFVYHEAWGHDNPYTMYTVNEGYGYNIIFKNRDFIFSINPKAKGHVDYLWINMDTHTNEPGGWQGKTVEGELNVRLRTEG
jgi:hypothetical protein